MSPMDGQPEPRGTSGDIYPLPGIPAPKIEDFKVPEDPIMQAKRPRFDLYTFEEILNSAPPVQIVRGVIARGDIVQLYGPPSAAKTFVVMDFAASCAKGEPFAKGGGFQGFEIPARLHCIHAVGEGRYGISKRWRALNLHRSMTPEDWRHYHTIQNLPNLLEKEEVEEFIDRVKAAIKEKGWLPPDVLIFDTQARATPGAEENSSKDMGLMIQALERIRDALDGPTMFLVHHSGLEGGRARGSSAQQAAVDVQFELTKSDMTLKLTCTKLKDEDSDWLLDGELVIKELDEGLTSCAIDWKGKRCKSEAKASSGKDERKIPNAEFNFLCAFEMLQEQQPKVKQFTAAELAKAAGVKAPNAAGILKRLHEKCLVQKWTDEHPTKWSISSTGASLLCMDGEE